MALSFKLLSLRTFLVSVVLFGALIWLDRNDPDPFDIGNLAFFVIIAATSQAISLAFFCGRCLLDTYPHILSNVIAIIVVMIALLSVLI
jgi:hypothetical protein